MVSLGDRKTRSVTLGGWRDGKVESGANPAWSPPSQQPEAGASQEALPGSKAGPGAEETWKIQKELDEETERRQQLEHEVRSAQEEVRALRSQSPQEAVVTKEVLRKVPDPALEESFQQAQQTLAEEQRKNRLLQGEVEALRLQLRALEEEARAGGQEYVVKEVLRLLPPVSGGYRTALRTFELDVSAPPARPALQPAAGEVG